jgi:hypothetical protein
MKRKSEYNGGMKYENIKDFKEAEFRQVTGVTPRTFYAMLEVVKEAYKETHKRHNGRPRKLSREDMLLMTLEYYKEYRTLECIGASYGLKKSNVGKTIEWVEAALIQSGLFSLPGKKKLAQPKTEYDVVVVDTTETPIQRPTRGQKHYYSGKKNGIR